MLSKLYKILGQLKDKDGAGVVGHNTAESGDAIGVEGATESDEGYGLYTEDDARVGDEMSSSSLSTDRATINNSVTVYVRSGGSDSNDGLSASEPRATLQAAIKDAPIQPYQSKLTINVDKSASFEGVDLRDLETPRLKIVGATDGNDDADTTIDGSATGASHSVELAGNDVELRNCIVKDNGDGCYRLNRGARLELSNCDIINEASDHTGQVNTGSVIVDDGDTTHDQTATTGGQASVNILESWAQLRGNFNGPGNAAIVRLKEGSFVIAVGGSFNGSGEAVNCLRLYHRSGAKVDSCTFEDAANAIEPKQGSWARVTTGITENNISNRFSGGSSHAVDFVAGDSWWQLPRNAGPPDHWGKNVAQGTLFYDNSDDFVKAYSGIGIGRTLEMGRVPEDEGTVSLSAGGSQTVNWAGGVGGGKHYDAVVSPADPDNAAGNAQWRHYWQWNDTDGQQELVIEELSGSQGIDLDWRVYRFPDA
jgi:hypothetical protein